MPYLYLLIALLLPQLSFSDGIKCVTRADGIMECSNIPKGQENTYNIEGSSDHTSQLYIYNKPGETVMLTDKRPVGQQDVKVLTFKVSCFACDPDSTIDWNGIGLNHTAYAKTIQQASEKYKVSPSLIRAVIHAESAFKSKAKSSAGAQGLMQLMPATAKGLGVKDSLNPTQNIHGGTKYLSQMLAKFDNNISLAAAAYNAGPGAVTKYNGIPPYKETQVYVKRVKLLQKRYQNEAPS